MSIDCSWGFSFQLGLLDCRSNCQNNLNILKQQKQSERLHSQHISQSSISKLSVLSYQPETQSIPSNNQRQKIKLNKRIESLKQKNIAPHLILNEFHQRSSKDHMSPRIVQTQNQRPTHHHYVSPGRKVHAFPVQAWKNHHSNLLNQKFPIQQKFIISPQPHFQPLNVFTHSMTKQSDITTNCNQSLYPKVNIHEASDRQHQHKKQNMISQMSNPRFTQFQQSLSVQSRDKPVIRQVMSLIGTEQNIRSSVILQHKNMVDSQGHPKGVTIRQIFQQHKK